MNQNTQRAPDADYFSIGLSADRQGDTALAMRYYNLAWRLTWCPQISRDAKCWWEQPKQSVPSK